MKKTTVYLPESLKQEIARRARQLLCSEAEVIRRAIREAVTRPRPRPGILRGDDAWAESVDEYLEGFGAR